MSVWEYGRELRIKAARAGQGRIGWVGEGQTAGTATRGKEPGRGAHPRQGGKSELLRVARPSDPLRSCSHWDRRKEEGWPEPRSRGRAQVGRRSGCLIRLEVRGGAGPEIRPGRNRMSVLEREGEDSAKHPGSGPSWLLPQWPCPRSPSLSSQLQVHPGARILDPFAMRVVRGLEPLLCLLLLVLLDPHSPEGGHLPQRRFEYKLSFKGPRLALPGVGIPFWSHHGGKMSGED